MHILMNLACRRFKTHPAEILRVAALHTHQNLTASEMHQEYKAQTANGRWEQWVLDTCLDCLSGRIEAQVMIPEYGLTWVIRPLNMIPNGEKWRKGEDEVWHESC